MNQNPDILTVYHGTISLIGSVDVSKGKPYKDFGRGFYVTQDFAHAKNLANRNRLLEQERFKQKFSAYVYTYALDMNVVRTFHVKEFPAADIDWMRFVLSNRSVRDKNHSYDVVIGPTANDDTSLVLKSYFSGLYGDVDSERAITIALEMIEAENLPEQIYFGLNCALVSLSQKGSVRKI